MSNNFKKILSFVIVLIVLIVAVTLADTAFAADVAVQKASKTAYEPSVGSQFIRMILGLALVVGLIIGIGWLARRYGALKIGPDGVLAIKGGVSVGPKERVVLLEVGDEQILVGVAPGSVTKLHVLPTKITSGRTEIVQDGNQFLARLKNAIKEKGGQ